jgi:hypothetical protein
MVATTTQRVPMHTAPEVNERIREQTERNVAYYRLNPDRIDQRLRELDAEWDIERGLQVMSSAATLLGLTLTAVGGRRFLILPLVVQGFFLQHALQGWCPPLPALRRAGMRTPKEIEDERHALLMIRREERPQPDEQRAI